MRILIADDHAIVRDGLRSLIEAQPDLVVIGEAADGEVAWSRSCELRPDVLLLDVSMPVMSGIDAAERIGRDCPEVKVLMLSAHEERGYVARALRAGAAGYLAKRMAAAGVVQAIRTVATGGAYVDPSLAGALLSDTSRGTPGEVEPTPREGEVLRLVVQGYLNKEIAAKLGISVKTVETHKANGMARLGMVSRAALVRYALRCGWLDEG